MSNSKLSGLALLLPVPAMVLWFIYGGAILDGAGPDKPAEYIAALGANAAPAKYIMCIATLMFLTAMGALGYIKKTMEGGPGHHIASFAWFLIIIGAAGQIGETAFTIAVAEAAESAVAAGTAAAAAAAAGADATAAMTAAAGALVLVVSARTGALTTGVSHFQMTTS